MAVALALVAAVWARTLALGFTGEDYVLLGRALRGEATTHVVRPFADLVTSWMHSVVGVESALPYHVLTLGLHLCNVALVFVLVRGLTRNAQQAGFVAVLFGLGAGVADSLCWIAALNRPLSAFGQLVALNGVIRLGRAPVAGSVAVALGLVWQFGANEEVYGTCLAVAVWALADRTSGQRRTFFRPALALAAVGVLLLHYFVFAVVPDRPLVERMSPAGSLQSASTRTVGILAGLGLSAGPGGVLLALGALLLMAVPPRRAGAFALLWWAAAFVPFALSESMPYRAYPSQAPTALLLSGLLVAPAAWLERRRAVAAGALWLSALLLAGTRAALRAHDRIASWEAAQAEVAECEPLFESWSRESRTTPPLLNLEATTLGVATYWFDSEATGTLTNYGILDGATAWVRQDLPEVVLGKRFDGTYGSIDTTTYFDGRTEVTALRGYGEWIVAGGPEEASRLLRDPAVDLATRCVIDFGVGERVELPPAPGPAHVDVTTVRAFEFDAAARQATMAVSIAADAPAVLACLEPWLYDSVYRFSPDQALLANVDERRRVRWTATRVDTGEALQTFFVDAWGLGALLPPGRYGLELCWRIASGGELRR